jgi:hypothetical protein
LARRNLGTGERPESVSRVRMSEEKCAEKTCVEPTLAVSRVRWRTLVTPASEGKELGQGGYVLCRPMWRGDPNLSCAGTNLGKLLRGGLHVRVAKIRVTS